MDSNGFPNGFPQNPNSVLILWNPWNLEDSIGILWNLQDSKHVDSCGFCGPSALNQGFLWIPQESGGFRQSPVKMCMEP
jgi:hypothetical protein